MQNLKKKLKFKLSLINFIKLRRILIFKLIAIFPPICSVNKTI